MGYTDTLKCSALYCTLQLCRPSTQPTCNLPASLKGTACGARSQNLLCMSVNRSHEIHSQLP